MSAMRRDLNLISWVVERLKEVINCTGCDLDSEDDNIAGRGDGEEEVGQVNYPGVGQGQGTPSHGLGIHSSYVQQCVVTYLVHLIYIQSCPGYMAY